MTTAAARSPRRGPPPILEVEDLVVEFRQQDRVVRAVNHVSLSIRHGETLGIVGESGSGKSVLCRTILRLLPSPPAFIRSGRIIFGGRDLLALAEAEMRKFRGADIAMIFQNPMNALNPVWPIGDQVSEGQRVHQRLGPRAARARAIELLRRSASQAPNSASTNIRTNGRAAWCSAPSSPWPLPAGRSSSSPTSRRPRSTSPSRTRSWRLLMDLQEVTGTTLVLVSHDMAVVAETCDRVAVMYAGRIVELAPTAEIFRSPAPSLHSWPHALDSADRWQRLSGSNRSRPAAQSVEPAARLPLRAALPLRRSPNAAIAEIELREIAPGHFSACLFPELVDGGDHDRAMRRCHCCRSGILSSSFRAGGSSAESRWRAQRRPARAVDGVSLDIHPHETVGLVGESGSGKTTLGRAILGPLSPRFGHRFCSAAKISSIRTPATRQSLHRSLQMVFQNPFSSLNPRMTVAQTIGEALRFHAIVPRAGHSGRDRAPAWPGRPRARNGDAHAPRPERRPVPARRPGPRHERAGPAMLVLDEAVAALDVSIQAQVLNLLLDLRRISA